MVAVRGNERAAAGLGINVVTTKLSAFGIAAAITGLGGALSHIQRARGVVHRMPQCSTMSTHLRTA